MVRLVKVGKAVKPVRVRCGRDLVHFTGLLRVRCGWDLVHFTGLLRVRCGQDLVHFTGLLRVTWAAPGTLHRAA